MEKQNFPNNFQSSEEKINLEGLFSDFTLRVHGTISRSGIRPTLSIFLFFSIPVVALGRFYDVTDRSNNAITVTIFDRSVTL